MSGTELSFALPKGTPPELIAGIADAARRTFDRHGHAAFAMPRNAALAHEAGHAIVGAHEGLSLRRVAVFSRRSAGVELWGGVCTEAGGWTSGPDTRADDDLRRARFIIAGLAGEAITRTDVPASSLDELALSQFVTVNAAAKLADPQLSDEHYAAFVKQLWHERVSIVPSWFLLEADWCQTKQALPLMAMCSDIIAIGRVRWIEGTTTSCYENSAWCRFDARHAAGPIFHPYRSAPLSPRATRCAQCGIAYQPRRSDSKFCGDACRQRAHRELSRDIAVTTTGEAP